MCRNASLLTQSDSSKSCITYLAMLPNLPSLVSWKLQLTSMMASWQLMSRTQASVFQQKISQSFFSISVHWQRREISIEGVWVSGSLFQRWLFNSWRVTFLSHQNLKRGPSSHSKCRLISSSTVLNRLNDSLTYLAFTRSATLKEGWGIKTTNF